MIEEKMNIHENDYDAKKTEYIILRKEMQSLFERQHTLETTMISVYCLILAYLLSTKNTDPLSFLVPIPLLLAFYKRRYAINFSIWKGASYCIIFFTKYGFMWEDRLKKVRKMDEHFKNGKKRWYEKPSGLEWECFILCVICLILCFIKLKQGDKTILPLSIKEYFDIIAIISGVCIFLYFLLRPVFGMTNYLDVFHDEMENWERVKYDEENEKNFGIYNDDNKKISHTN